MVNFKNFFRKNSFVLRALCKGPTPFEKEYQTWEMETWGTSCFNMHFQNHSLGTLEIQTALGFKNSFMVENMYFFIAYIISNFKARAGNSTLSYTINWNIFCYCFVNASTSSYWNCFVRMKMIPKSILLHNIFPGKHLKFHFFALNLFWNFD